ncbi:TonB-dependent siderophore receptor [Pseudomonas fildesensis]|uniref:Ligand-gated channel protein n=1 Tax=Pseudomonas fildesensis TaxID=1674920 RepID=A0A0J8FYC2_9PSED|nr:TonB-dependent siderophore receptor [Pseudomonas fildesensis]KMT53363.1 ligand-gated channel protein [Pseudomonas fildesensis]
MAHRFAARPLLALAISMACSTAPLYLQAAETTQAQAYRFDIPGQSLDGALAAFSAVTRIQVLVSGELTQGVVSPGVSGNLGQREALGQLLGGTGLSAAFINADTVTLEKRTATGSAIEVGATTISAERLGATTEGSGSYTTGAVTLGKGEQKLKDIPQSVSVMTRKQMDDQNTTKLSEVVKRTPGLTATKSPGPGLFIFSRGFEIGTLQYDGVGIARNTYALGSYLTENMAIYDRVETLRGPAALLQGANSPGGTMNLVRKRGQQAPTVTITAKAGSWDHYGTQVDAGGPLNAEGTLRGRFVADYDTTNSFVDYAGSWNQTVYAAVDYDFTPDTTVGVGISNQKGHARPNFMSLPRYANGSDLGLPRSTFVGASWNRSVNNQTQVFADIEHRFNDDWKLKAAVIAMDEHNDATYQATWDEIPNPGTAGNVRYVDWVTDFNTKSRGVDVYVNGKFETLGFQQELVLGANYSKLTTHDLYARDATDGADIFNIDHNRPQRDKYQLFQDGSGSKSWYDIRQKGIYGTWRVKVLDPLTLIVGARTSWYDFSYIDQSGFQGVYDNPTQSTTQTTGRVTPYAGLVYALNDQWSAYASYADAFEPQTNLTTSGSMLKPIEGQNYELGIKGELADGRLNTSFAIFRYDQENRGVQDLQGPMNCGGWYCSVASGKVRSQGFEATLSGEVLPGLQLVSSYTYNTTKFLKDDTYEGKIFSTWTPKHLLKVWGDYQLPGDWQKVSVGAGVTAQSSTEAYDRNFSVPGNALWDSRVAYKINQEFTVAANLNNMFDKKYYIPAYNATWGSNYYGDPRNVMFTMTYTPQF